jgi:hypothetical protein
VQWINSAAEIPEAAQIWFFQKTILVPGSAIPRTRIFRPLELSVQINGLDMFNNELMNLYG